jgi:hypothetical protein
MYLLFLANIIPDVAKLTYLFLCNYFFVSQVNAFRYVISTVCLMKATVLLTHTGTSYSPLNPIAGTMFNYKITPVCNGKSCSPCEFKVKYEK